MLGVVVFVLGIFLLYVMFCCVVWCFFCVFFVICDVLYLCFVVFFVLSGCGLFVLNLF